jgi:hypothetical protein
MVGGEMHLSMPDMGMEDGCLAGCDCGVWLADAGYKKAMKDVDSAIKSVD